MFAVSLPTSPSHHVSLGSDLAQQRGSFSAPEGGTRMRWVQTEKQTPAPGKLVKKPPQPATPDASSPVGKLPTLTPMPTRTLAAFEKLQRQLDRCDQRDLADYASVLRVSDHAAVLSTAALMKLPGQIRDAKAAVACAIDALKACDQMPSREEQLIYARKHNKAAAVLQGLKRANPLPLPRLHEADAMGNLIRGSESRSKRVHPRTSSASSLRPRPLPLPLRAPAAPAHPRPPTVEAANTRRPHERSYVESLRTSAAPCLVHSPEKPVVKLNSGATKQQRDAFWQGKQIEREKKLWSAAALEKGNMAEALGATEEALTQYAAQRHALLTPTRLDAVASALERLAPLKKKCKELDPKDTSPAARACRAQASQENIRANNLLGSFVPRIPKKAHLEKQLVKRRIANEIKRRLPTVPETTVLTTASIAASNAASNAILKSAVKPAPQPVTKAAQYDEPQIQAVTKQRARWTVPVNPFTPRVSPDKGYDSDEKMNAKLDALFLNEPFLLDDTLPSWARKGLLNLEPRIKTS